MQKWGSFVVGIGLMVSAFSQAIWANKNKIVKKETKLYLYHCGDTDLLSGRVVEGFSDQFQCVTNEDQNVFVKINLRDQTFVREVMGEQMVGKIDGKHCNVTAQNEVQQTQQGKRSFSFPKHRMQRIAIPVDIDGYCDSTPCMFWITNEKFTVEYSSGKREERPYTLWIHQMDNKEMGR
ncbi:MAG: hypothetical protein NZ480_01785, partial [Bdellovibrionaceae bacterium]|nr:hypothetical protein [Pseudobdellovibrionaceae bacterium]MDW8190693.1 hypothetical protein [Pseudobdellovibrionaceae bacterium]